MAKAKKNTGSGEELNQEGLSDRDRQVQQAMSALRKQFGEDVVQTVGSNGEGGINTKFNSTGILSVDRALGGGLPEGRIIEIYGPESGGKTTLTLTYIAEMQKMGHLAAFIDVEHAFDPKWAANLGVDLDALLFSQPDNGEQALEVMEALIRTGYVHVVVLDSVAALVPKKELEGDMGDHNVGSHAKLMSQAMRKLTSAISKSHTTAIFINQIREKVGVMFGCFHGDTQVMLADGTSMKISKIVKEEISPMVLAYDEVSGKIVERKVIDWHSNGHVENNDDFMHFTVNGYGSGGVQGFCCTPNHKILTSNGWTEASDINIGDSLISYYESSLDAYSIQVIVGSILGDGHIYKKGEKASFNLQNLEQPEYIKWKLSMLPSLSFKDVRYKAHGKNLTKHASNFSMELSLIKSKYEDIGSAIRKLDSLGLAVWYMDDGHFKQSHKNGSISVKRLSSQDGMTAANMLSDKFNIKCSYSESQKSIVFNVESFIDLCNIIHKHIPEAMQYKLLKEFRGFYEHIEPSILSQRETVPMQVLRKRQASDRQMRQKAKYDITVDGAHTYMVGGNGNGVIVHNSPETTTGGRALKFFATQRIEVRRVETIKEGDKDVGNRVKIKVAKNKVAPPFKIAEYELRFDSGIDKLKDLIEVGTAAGLIEKGGAWYTYEGNKAQGVNQMKELLKANPELVQKLTEQLIELN